MSYRICLIQTLVSRLYSMQKHSEVFSCDQPALWMVQSVRPSVRLSVTPLWLCSHHCIIMKFSGVITNDRSDVHAKGQGQRSKVKVIEVKTQLSHFLTVTPVWIHIWRWNDVGKERCPIVFQGHPSNFKVTRLEKNQRFWPKFPDPNSNLNGYEMMHKAWSSIEEVPYCFLRSSVKFQGHIRQKIANFDPNWGFPDCNLSLNSPIDLKWCIKLDVV